MQRLDPNSLGGAVMGDRSWFIDVAGALYGIAMFKYTTRQTLSPDNGIQGYVEIICLLGTLVCAYLGTRAAQRRFASSIPSLCFGVFGILTTASYWRSYDPPLSLAKGLLLLAALSTAYLTCQAGLGQRFFQSIYWGFITLLMTGLVLGLVQPDHYPLFQVDQFSGRSKLSLFDTHPGVVAECCAMLILIAPLLHNKPHWASQLFLFGVNLFSGEKAATGGLILCLLIRAALSAVRWKARRKLAVGSIITLATLFGVYLALSRSPAVLAMLAGAFERIYGTNTATEARTLNGRTDLWRGAMGLVVDSGFFGYGIDGARDLLIRIAPWSGQSHNGFIEVALESGLCGASFFFGGVVGVALACFKTRSAFRTLVLPLLVYELGIAAIGSIFNSPVNFGVLCLFWLLYQAKANASVGRIGSIATSNKWFDPKGLPRLAPERELIP